ncbi:MAG: polysaccharide deacetylase family protein [Myxococcota bacterium]
MYSKKLIWIGPLLLGSLACSSNSDDGGTGGKQSGNGGAKTGQGGSTNGSGGTTGGTNTGNGGATSGGASSGGASMGGSSNGGTNTGSGGASGGKSNASGGSSSGGSSSGGASSGGAQAGGASSGGASSGGKSNSGGAPASGGASTGGSAGMGGSAPTGTSGLPVPPGAANQPKPSGTPNGIQVLGWAGFKAAVTYSFDDNTDSQIANYSQLQAAGGQYTFYLWTGRSQAMNSVWKTAVKDGHEIGNHSNSHSPSNCTSGDISSATTFIQNNLSVKPWTFAAPNGDGCYKTPASGLFFINRGVSPASPVTVSGNADPLNLNCYIPNEGQQASTFNGNIDTARSQNGWVIYVIHGFTNSDGSYKPVDIGQMTTAIKYAKGLGDVWVGSMVNVGSYWLGHKAFNSAMTSTSGSDKTWTWTLPNYFPTGKYLRVKVDGGTLKQNGTALTWDPHGYYEISLDAKSVTLSP